MPPKIGRARKMQKRKNNLVQDGGNINKMSKSQKCPISKRRKIIPDSTTNFNRRCTLRSSTRPQTGTTSLEQVGETNVEVEEAIPLEQLAELGEVEAEVIPHEQAGEMHVDAAEMLFSSCSIQNAGEAETVPLEQEPLEGEIKASSAGCSAPPISLKLTELVDTMRNEDKGAAEMLFSSCSNQNAGAAETVPLEQEPLAGEIQASKSGCSAPPISLKLTELVDLMRNEDDDNEIDSTAQSWLEDTVNGYKVDAEFKPILCKIIDKHGDIAKNCKGSVEYRSMFLDRICRIVSELEKKNVRNINEKELEKHIVLVDDIKTNEIEVKWLRTRLTEILEARHIFKTCGKLKEKLDNHRGCTKIAVSALKSLEDQKKEAYEKLEKICQQEAEWKEKLDRSQDDSTKTSEEIKDATSKFKRFLDSSLVDDLL